MSKQRPDGDKLVNEMVGASAFFRSSARPITTSDTDDTSPSPVIQPVTPEPLVQNDVVTSRRADVTPLPATEPVGFDINHETASRDSLRLAVEETKAVDALRASLKWDQDLTVSKNDICRVALHHLLEDFAAKGDKSQAVARLRRKRSSR